MNNAFIGARDLSHCEIAAQHSLSTAMMTRFVFFSGLGIDGRLFLPQRELGDIETPPWLEPRDNESVSDYSRRMVATIRTPPPFFLGGVSFGSMVALEAARHVPSTGVFLISGARSGKSVGTFLKPLGKLAPLIPEAALTNLRPLVRPALYFLGEPVTGKQVKLMEAMFSISSPRLVKWGINAVMDWKFDYADPVPVYAIHGSIDKMIPARNVKSHVVVRGGGHLINVTHAGMVNEFIRQQMTEPLGR